MNPSHRSYQELCSDPALCPLGNVPSDEFICGTARIFSHWDQAHTAEQLCDDVVANLGSRMNGAIVVLVESTEANTGVLQVLHSIAKSAGPAFYRQAFAYLGDVQGGHIETVGLDMTLLDTLPETRICDAPARQLQLLANVDARLLPAHAANAAATKVVMTRHAMYLPYPLVPLLIDEDLTPYDALQLLLPIIDDLGMEATCQPLLDWLLVATTSGDANGAPSLLRRPQAGVTPQNLRTVRVERDEDLLHRHLPILKHTRNRTDPAVLGILQATRDQRNAVTADLEDRRMDRERDRAPKLIAEKWRPPASAPLAAPVQPPALSPPPPAWVPANSPSPATSPPPPARVPASMPSPYPPDPLDDLIATATANFIRSTSWEHFFDLQRDPRGDWGDIDSISHPAFHLLKHYRSHGVPVRLQSPRWPLARKLAALNRGPHKSAKEHVDFLREEYVGMIQKGHWVLLPAQLLIDHPDLRLSPLGVIPQRDRRPRTISDYTYFGVNPGS